MTQKNIDIMDIIVNELAAGKTISDALKTVYSKRNVVIPYNEELLSAGVEKLGMSLRTTNALRRSKINTLMDVVNYCQKQKITTVKTFGHNSGIELFETILNYLWDRMSLKERTDFLVDTVERNEGNLL